ncbi:hypothetical protein GGX14DRAFT_393155 [Mycena pura]|uniref:Uncharacterized protein n=1 Tax=Mycena pura TaxID=153505 RepID=A0AAD6VH59_9AGAR|nr:hypothetical protein GGX14DRAFT_393155 [Mycena pura]
MSTAPEDGAEVNVPPQTPQHRPSVRGARPHPRARRGPPSRRPQRARTAAACARARRRAAAAVLQRAVVVLVRTRRVKHAREHAPHGGAHLGDGAPRDARHRVGVAGDEDADAQVERGVWPRGAGRDLQKVRREPVDCACCQRRAGTSGRGTRTEGPPAPDHAGGLRHGRGCGGGGGRVQGDAARIERVEHAERIDDGTGLDVLAHAPAARRKRDVDLRGSLAGRSRKRIMKRREDWLRKEHRKPWGDSPDSSPPYPRALR